MAVKNGKKLEELVKLIQEVLKNSPNTIVYGNKKVRNRGGNKREFDIFIESNINGIPINIAIECKDYAKPVSVDKIEAFQTKCDRIPEINKKVFVSANGYQRDAIQAAKELGIELYHVADIDRSTIKNWLPIKQLGLRFLVTCIRYVLLEATSKQLDFVNNNINDCSFIYQGTKGDIKQLIDQSIMKEKNHLWNYAIINFMHNSTVEKLGGTLTFDFNLDLRDNNAYIKCNEDLIKLAQVNGAVDFWFIETDPVYLSIKDYSTQHVSKAKYVELGHLDQGKTEIIITPEKFKFYHTFLPNGKRQALVSLGVYDPEKNTFTRHYHDSNE